MCVSIHGGDFQQLEHLSLTLESKSTRWINLTLYSKSGGCLKGVIFCRSIDLPLQSEDLRRIWKTKHRKGWIWIRIRLDKIKHSEYKNTMIYIASVILTNFTNMVGRFTFDQECLLWKKKTKKRSEKRKELILVPCSKYDYLLKNRTFLNVHCIFCDAWNNRRNGRCLQKKASSFV